jgi:hypothetical protein
LKNHSYSILYKIIGLVGMPWSRTLHIFIFPFFLHQCRERIGFEDCIHSLAYRPGTFDTESAFV